jgi:hypothetical protein
MTSTRNALFWVFTQRVVVLDIAGVSEQPVGLIFKGKESFLESKVFSFLDS